VSSDEVRRLHREEGGIPERSGIDRRGTGKRSHEGIVIRNPDIPRKSRVTSGPSPGARLQAQLAPAALGAGRPARGNDGDVFAYRRPGEQHPLPGLSLDTR
jgi:hypothetical protein